jgi:hypothetical protein
MKTFFNLLAAISTSTALAGALMAEPASAQWVPSMSRQQMNYQRSNGWSSGDYFGPARYQQPQRSPYGSYTPGLNNNVRYQPNSCATYLYC